MCIEVCDLGIHCLCCVVYEEMTLAVRNPPRQTPPLETATAVDGTHPTGMHPCLLCFCATKSQYIFSISRDLETRSQRSACFYIYLKNELSVGHEMTQEKGVSVTPGFNTFEKKIITNIKTFT